MRDFHPSRGIPMGIETKLLKLMGMGQEWEQLRWEWECLLLMCFHLVIIFPPKSAFDLVNLYLYIAFSPLVIILSFWWLLHNFLFRSKFKLSNCVKNLSIFAV